MIVKGIIFIALVLLLALSLPADEIEFQQNNFGGQTFTWTWDMTEGMVVPLTATLLTEQCTACAPDNGTPLYGECGFTANGASFLSPDCDGFYNTQYGSIYPFGTWTVGDGTMVVSDITPGADPPTPTPEPATWLLLAVSLIALSGRTLKRGRPAPSL